MLKRMIATMFVILLSASALAAQVESPKQMPVPATEKQQA